MNEKHMPCAYWREGELCAKDTEPGYTDFCVLGPCSQMKPSKADEIRQMSDEELAEFLAKNQKIGDIEQHKDGYFRLWLDWLKEEAEGAE